MTKSTTGNAVDPNGVNHPSHYNLDPSGIECIEVVRYLNFNVGNAYKYAFRAGKKKLTYQDDIMATIHDLEKAIWYLDDEIKNWTYNMPEGNQIAVNKMIKVINSRDGLYRTFYERILNSYETYDYQMYLLELTCARGALAEIVLEYEDSNT